MCVKGINLEAVDFMPNHNVVAVIREGRFSVDIGDGAIGGGHDRIGGLAMFVALEAAYVEAFVQLMAVATDTTESARGPGFAGGADKEFFLAAFFEERSFSNFELILRSARLAASLLIRKRTLLPSM